MQKNEIEALCKKLKPIIGEKADRLWHIFLSADFKEYRALESEIEICTEKYLKQVPLTKSQNLLNPPRKEDAERIIYIGDVLYNRKRLYPFLRPWN